MRERIDRLLVNWEWRSCFPNATIEAVPAMDSNHCPLILKRDPLVIRKAGRFVYEDSWVEHKDFLKIVKTGGQALDEGIGIVENFKGVLSSLSNWSRVTFK